MQLTTTHYKRARNSLSSTQVLVTVFLFPTCNFITRTQIMSLPIIAFYNINIVFKKAYINLPNLKVIFVFNLILFYRNLDTSFNQINPPFKRNDFYWLWSGDIRKPKICLQFRLFSAVTSLAYNRCLNIAHAADLIYWFTIFS